MRRYFASAALIAIASYLGCSATKNQLAPTSGSSGTTGSGGAGGTGVSVAVSVGGQDGCVKFSAKAEVQPAAMLIVLDRSASMADGNKFTFAAQAIVQALDQPVFNTMQVGLMGVPSAPVKAPQCVLDASFGLISKVACGLPPFPQVELKLAGTQKSSDASGVRHDIKAWIATATNGPDVDDPDSTPMYGALQLALGTLQALDMKRILLVVTDGSFGCTVFSNRPGYDDCNGCKHEWEDPSNVIKMLQTANSDAAAPVETFLVGVPGADTYDKSGCVSPPYHMRAALSAIAYAGSPKFVPQSCTGKTYTQATLDPATSCHVDLTQGNFKAAALATTIKDVRSQVVGCVYPLPMAPSGQTIDLDAVNVEVTINGSKQTIKKRS
jgi:hypothetical protein